MRAARSKAVAAGPSRPLVSAARPVCSSVSMRWPRPGKRVRTATAVQGVRLAPGACERAQADSTSGSASACSSPRATTSARQPPARRGSSTCARTWAAPALASAGISAATRSQAIPKRPSFCDCPQ